MPKSLTISFLRHGQSTHSVAERYCGAGTDAPLTPDGERMAEAFARAYRSTPWSAVFCSSQLRARQTVAPLAEAIGATPEFRDGLVEINYGSWEGMLPAEIQARFPSELACWLRDPVLTAPPGGETAAVVRDRALKVVDEIRSRFSEGHVLVVAHKTTIRVILASLLEIPLAEYRNRLACPVCSISSVQFLERGPQLLTLGDRHHFPAELLNLPGS